MEMIMTWNRSKVIKRSILVLAILVICVMLMETYMPRDKGVIFLHLLDGYQKVTKTTGLLVNKNDADNKTTLTNNAPPPVRHVEKWGLSSGLINEWIPLPSSNLRVDSTDPNKATIVLIVAYLRSGSTFTASLFSKAPGVFFVFEPLHILYKRIQRRGQIKYLNGTTRNFPDGQVPSWLPRESIDNWIHCRLRGIDRESLLDGFHFVYSLRSMKPFLFCVKHKRLRNPSYTFAIKECLPRLERYCGKSTMRAYKTIRLPMTIGRDLMHDYPNVKVIHLVRDPRGMFLSQYRGRFMRNTSEEHIKKYCTRIVNDLEVSKQLLKSENKNFKILRYEDLAMNPFSEAKTIYDFTNIQFTDELKAYVKLSTSLNRTDGCAYCTTRGNSTRTAFKWRDKITLPLLDHINTYCDERLFKQLGYIKLTSIGQVRNQSIQSMYKDDVRKYLLR